MKTIAILILMLIRLSTQLECIDENVEKKLIPILVDGIPNQILSMYKMIEYYVNIWGPTGEIIQIKQLWNIFIFRNKSNLLTISNMTNSSLSLEELNLYIVYTNYLIYIAGIFGHNLHDEIIQGIILKCIKNGYKNESYLEKCAYNSFDRIILNTDNFC